MADRSLVLTPKAAPVSAWLRELWAHREVTSILARKDFHVRYKRAVFGLVWAVGIPLLQTAILAAVFLKIGNFGNGDFSYPIFAMAGVLAWSYFAATLTPGSTAIVDAASLTDKVWFPRAILPVVPALANTVGLGVSMVALLIALPLFHVAYTVRLLMLVPACLLLVAFSIGITLLLSALHVYFRDVRYLVSASTMIWFYITPVVYPLGVLGGAARWLQLNPMTGVIGLFQYAVVGTTEGFPMSIAVAVASTVVLLVVGALAQSRHDRLFVDLL